MLVKTINPVYVNGAKKSRPSEYLSANGMGEYETTQHDDFLSFDASKASQKQIESFQVWYNKKGYTPYLKEDGLWTRKDGKKSDTQKAIDKYGSEFDKVIATMAGIVYGGRATGGNTSSEPSTQQKIEQAKAGKVWDRAKGWIESGKAQNVLAQLQNLKAQGGIRGLLGGLFGGGQQSGNADMGADIPTETPPPPPKGLPKGAKIGMAVGAVLVVGIIIYAVTRPKTAKA